jgi:hypothetical protein
MWRYVTESNKMTALGNLHPTPELTETVFSTLLSAIRLDTLLACATLARHGASYVMLMSADTS